MTSGIRFDDVRKWLFDSALPFWTENASDPHGHGFVEQLDLSGAPRDPGFKRIRTQARQVYSFCHAFRLGWAPALPVAEAGYRALMSLEMEGGGFPRTVRRDGSVLDPTLDLYDQAFALNAMAWWRRISDDGAAVSAADRLLTTLDDRLRSTQGRGFLTAFPDPSGRTQNPHMHLLEASLAWLESGEYPRVRALANELVDMHVELFQQGEDGVLAESFDVLWRPLNSEAGQRIEPGHQYEWVWLLGQAQRILERDLKQPARRLHRFARGHGHNPNTGLCWDVIDSNGVVLTPTSRIWAQTEALKAELALGEHWGGFDHRRLAQVVNLLLDKHLAWEPAGTWVDCFDAEGRPVADHIPASILYHVLLAFAELLRLEDRILEDADDGRRGAAG